MDEFWLGRRGRNWMRSAAGIASPRIDWGEIFGIVVSNYFMPLLHCLGNDGWMNFGSTSRSELYDLGDIGFRCDLWLRRADDCGVAWGVA